MAIHRKLDDAADACAPCERVWQAWVKCGIPDDDGRYDWTMWVNAPDEEAARLQMQTYLDNAGEGGEIISLDEEIFS